MTKHYDEYKDSGIEWLGEIPSHWDTIRLKDKISISSGKSATKTDEGYLLYGANGIIGKTNNYNIDRKKIIIGRVGSCGAINIAKERSFISDNALIVDEKSILFDYLYYLLINKNLANLASKVAMPLITATGVLEEKSPFINDKNEQQAIADYLENKTSKIDSAVSELEKQKSLLIELKKSTIHQAVTKGLDLTVPMKDSGVEWIGEVAKGFKTLKLKNIIGFYNGYSFTDEDLSDNETGSFLIRIGNLKANGTLDPYKSPRYLKNTPSKFKIENDSILMALSGATAGKAVYFDNCEEDLYLNQRVAKIKSYSENLKYLYYYLSLDEVTVELMNIAKITTHPNFSKEHIMNLAISIPKKTKQDEIVAYLDKKTGQIDQSIEVIDNQIDKMKEYKKTLINDVVTGKIKVI